MVANSEIDLVQRVALLESRVAALEQNAPLPSPVSLPQEEEAGVAVSRVIGEVWQAAPLALRLKFVRELLPEAHSIQSVLKEAAALEDLRGAEGKAFETWISSYPSLFAEAVERLATKPPPGENAAEVLAVETLQEARQNLETDLSEWGIEWVLPASGTRLTAEMEVVGEEPAPVTPGSIAAVRRRGFRQRGMLVLPAQVLRAIPLRENHGGHGETRGEDYLTTENTERHGEREENTQYPIPEHLNTRMPENQKPETRNQKPVDVWPDWLRVFTQRSAGSNNTAIEAWGRAFQQVVAAVTQLASDTVLAERMGPLLPLLGARHVESQFALSPPWGEIFTEARDGMLGWLRAVAGIELISPSPGDPFDAATMQAVGVRRTAHAHEDNTIARVEQVGLRRGETPLFRAQVVRYELESG